MTAAAVVTPAGPNLIDRLLDRFFAMPKRPTEAKVDDRVSDFRAGLEAMATSPMAPPITEYAQYLIARHYGGGRG